MKRDSAVCTPQVVEVLALTQSEVMITRQALNEAIESVQSSLSSFLPPQRSAWNARDKMRSDKWRHRLQLYRQLLQNLGGNPDGELTSAEDMG